jgi:hypothetical protein
LGYVSAIDSKGRTIWIADAHRDDGKRFVVRADELLTAFVKLDVAIRAAERPEDRVASIKKDTEVKNNFGRERRGARASTN